MNKLLYLWPLCAIGSTLGLPALSGTPDASTPAVENICDPLKADGITPALYGLCVAFCEAQDVGTESTSISQSELEALEGEAPSGRILEIYNKKKRANEPAMPCIKAEQPCPCWTPDELASIDGTTPNGTSVQFICQTGFLNPTTGVPQARLIVEQNPELSARAFAYTNETVGERLVACDYIQEQTAPFEHRLLRETFGTLTLEEAQACVAQVNAACDANGL